MAQPQVVEDSRVKPEAAEMRKGHRGVGKGEGGCSKRGGQAVNHGCNSANTHVRSERQGVWALKACGAADGPRFNHIRSTAVQLPYAMQERRHVAPRHRGMTSREGARLWLEARTCPAAFHSSRTTPDDRRFHRLAREYHRNVSLDTRHPTTGKGSESRRRSRSVFPTPRLWCHISVQLLRDPTGKYVNCQL